MTYCLPVENVVITNRHFTGDRHALLDIAKLESALARPLHTGFGRRLYPTLFQRAGALLHGLCAAHAFEDGNKRTAWLSTEIFLEDHGVRLRDICQVEVADFVEAVAVSIDDIAVIAEWLVDRSD